MTVFIDFSNDCTGTYKNGEWTREIKLRPGHVSIHDGDATTYVYNLAGYGSGVLKSFLFWAESAFVQDNYSTEITGSYPRFQAEHNWLASGVQEHGYYVRYITADDASLCGHCIQDKANPITFNQSGSPTWDDPQWDIIGRELVEDAPFDCSHCGRTYTCDFTVSG